MTMIVHYIIDYLISGYYSFYNSRSGNGTQWLLIHRAQNQLGYLYRNRYRKWLVWLISWLFDKPGGLAGEGRKVKRGGKRRGERRGEKEEKADMLALREWL